MSETDNKEKRLDILYNMMHTREVATYSIVKTVEFQHWLDQLPLKTKTIVLARLNMVAVGHFGDHKRFEGLIELRWKNGNRVYGFLWGSSIVVTLYGGNKNGQDRDIKKAKKIRDEILDGTRTLHEPGTEEP